MSKRATPLKKPEIMLDQNASAPLYRQLYERLRGSILSGHLEAGTRLPSTRVLASSLSGTPQCPGRGTDAGTGQESGG